MHLTRDVYLSEEQDHAPVSVISFARLCWLYKSLTDGAVVNGQAALVERIGDSSDMRHIHQSIHNPLASGTDTSIRDIDLVVEQFLALG